MLSFDSIPLIDGHAHPLLPPETAAHEPFARYFTEAHDAEVVSRQAPHTLFYRHAIRELAGFLGCAPREVAVVAARAARPFPAYVRGLLADARVEAVLVDDGYPRWGALPPEWLARTGGIHVRRILRIERLIEDLIPACESLKQLQVALINRLELARPELAGLKSIIAYRSGLGIGRPLPEEAEVGLARVREQWGGTPGRLSAKLLLDYLVPVACAWAAAHGLPVQFHTGFGDRDIDLRTANPAHLRPLLEDGRLRGPVVLLHASWPYTREAAYLASVYPNVYVDLSEATPLLAGPALTRVLEELLALAPVTKVLYGSDAWGIPEWFWLAARAARRALATVLAGLPDDDATWAARRILHNNAAELYGLNEAISDER